MLFPVSRTFDPGFSNAKFLALPIFLFTVLAAYYPPTVFRTAVSWLRGDIVTSSQILLSRGVAGVDSDTPSESPPEAPLIAILENASIHILSLGSSPTSDITRISRQYPLPYVRYHITPRRTAATTNPLAEAPIVLNSPLPSHNAVPSPGNLMMSGALASPDNASAPLRPQASPRSSRSNSGQSSFSFGISSGESRPHTSSSEEQSPTRGRTMVRKPAHRTTNRRATTIQRPRTIEWDSIFTQQRLMSRDLTAEPRSIFDTILEPLPPGVERFRSSLSEELYRSATWGTTPDLSRFGGHRDTFAVLGLRHLQSRRIELPAMFFERLLSYVDFGTYLAIRLSCRCWSEAITRICPIVSPLRGGLLPTEILEKIYGYLDPLDFNAARHTCRAWMIASLEETLLKFMLGRGGWQGAANADANLRGARSQHNTADSINEEWILSKRLATECSLRPDWTGHGLPRGTPLSSTEEQLQLSSLQLASTTDFSELGNGYGPVGDTQRGSALHFTVSTCNNFVLVAEGCVIYIYSIQGNTSAGHHRKGTLSPLTAIVCPHRVLAVSMDTSAQRFAVAALLEGRVGVVCDISDSTVGSGRLSGPRALPTAVRDSRGSMHFRSSSDHAMTEFTSSHEYAEVANDRATARAIAEATLPEVHGVRATRQSWTVDDPLFTPRTMSRSSDYDIPMGAKCQMRVASGARSIYRNLCSAEDPPRSVAICPQRRCVAFGCAAGIELHWIDALTGQDLNRWFPLTAPSDFLYFLPPRPGVDSAKKLRLISSAGHPKQKETLQGRFFPDNVNDRTRHQGMTWDETFPGGGLGESAWRGTGWCDHFRAVPVSDGWNILFTDPEEGYLCLGSDSPPGARATKMIRRFVFTGPTDHDGKAIVPSLYTSGGELKWGVRIVVGYGEALWLFVIPPDVYCMNKGCGEGNNPEPTMVDGVEPTRIRGVEIGRIPALIDVAVDASGGDLTVWAFAADGMAYSWQVGSRDTFQKQRLVLRDGTICSEMDGEGDTVMHDQSGTAVHFDGNASTPFLQQSTRKQDRIIDNGGDVAMRDIDEDEGYSSEFDAAGGKFAIHAPPLWGKWSEEDADWIPDYLGHKGDDIEDEGVGVDVQEMSRMEVEVLCG